MNGAPHRPRAHRLRGLALALAALITVGAARPQPPVSGAHYRVYIVVWRGITDAERGFMDHFTEKGVKATFTVRDCNNDKKSLPAILAEIRRTRPDLVYTFGTTTTKFIVGGPGERGDFITDIPVVFNIVAKPIGSKLVTPPAFPSSIGLAEFEGNILARVEKSGDRDFLKRVYVKGGAGKGYGLRPGLSGGERNRITEILIAAGSLTLVSGRNLTGCSHLVPMDAQVNTIKSVIATRRMGVIYNPAEDNAIQQVDELQWYCRENGIELLRAPLPLDEVKKPGVDGIPGAVALLAEGGAELVYLPSDSFIIANAPAITEDLNRRGIKTFSATEDPVRKAGALMGLVSRYYNVGQFAGHKALQILVEKKQPGAIGIEPLKRYSFLVNMDTARRLAFYPPVAILKFAEIVSKKPGTRAP